MINEPPVEPRIENHQIEDAEIATDTKPAKDWTNELFETEKGIKLQLYKVSTDTVRKAWSMIPVPKPPMVYIEDRGREEPNPVDPGYKMELDQYNAKVNLLIYQIYLMRGVDIRFIPEGFPGPDEPEIWNEGLEDYLPVPVGKYARKAAWLADFVLNDYEKGNLIEELVKFSGMVPETKVEEASRSFRSDGLPGTDQQISPN